jgi:hypothetical protein
MVHLQNVPRPQDKMSQDKTTKYKMSQIQMFQALISSKPQNYPSLKTSQLQNGPKTKLSHLQNEPSLKISQLQNVPDTKGPKPQEQHRKYCTPSNIF